MLLRWWYLNSLAHFSLLISSLNSRSRGRYKEKVAPTSVLMVQSYRNLTMIQKSISGLLNHFYLRVLLIFDATRLIPKIKIDFCPNKRRLILQSCPLQLISIDSRSPSGLRLTKLQNGDQDVKFQFTQPKRAATWASGLRPSSSRVSIHAAQAGCDLCFLQFCSGATSFNSRSPSGLRRASCGAHRHHIQFQFTQPKRAATGRNREELADLMFQFTQPKRAATINSEKIVSISSFNSRSPSGLRRASSKTKLAKMTVSIHAAQAGCDTLATSQGSTQVSFNSRSPSGLRQVVAIQLIYSADVSIHAAQAGCDYGGISRTFLRSVSIHAAQAGCDLQVLTTNFFFYVSIHAAQAGCDDGVLACCTLAVVSIHAAQAGCDGCCKDTTKKRFSQRINRESPY